MRMRDVGTKFQVAGGGATWHPLTKMRALVASEGSEKDLANWAVVIETMTLLLFDSTKN